MLHSQIAIKCADLGHLSGAWPVHRRWVSHLKEEFFRQVCIVHDTLKEADEMIKSLHFMCLASCQHVYCCLWYLKTCSLQTWDSWLLLRLEIQRALLAQHLPMCQTEGMMATLFCKTLSYSPLAQIWIDLDTVLGLQGGSWHDTYTSRSFITVMQRHFTASSVCNVMACNQEHSMSLGGHALQPIAGASG